MSDVTEGIKNGASLNSRSKVRTFENSFHVVLALYLIYYIYWHTEQLSDDFLQEKLDGGCTKAGFYKDILCMSRQRFSRIMNQYSFSFTKDAERKLEEMFNIHFRSFDGDYIYSVLGVCKGECVDYIKEEYCIDRKSGKPKDGSGTDKEAKTKKEAKIKKEAEEQARRQRRNHIKVKNKLEEIMEKLDSGEFSDKDNPLYRIHYYFKNDRTYNRNKSYTDIVIEDLKKIRLDDWKRVDSLEKLRKYAEILGRHYQYIDSHLRMRETMEKDIKENPGVYL